MTVMALRRNDKQDICSYHTESRPLSPIKKLHYDPASRSTGNIFNIIKQLPIPQTPGMITKIQKEPAP
jgi:hypothetical protein